MEPNIPFNSSICKLRHASAMCRHFAKRRSARSKCRVPSLEVFLTSCPNNFCLCEFRSMCKISLFQPLAGWGFILNPLWWRQPHPLNTALVLARSAMLLTFRSCSSMRQFCGQKSRKQQHLLSKPLNVFMININICHRRAWPNSWTPWGILPSDTSLPEVDFHARTIPSQISSQ